MRDGRYPVGVFQTTSASQMLTQNGAEYFERNLTSLVEVAAANEVAVVLTTFAYAPSFVHETVWLHPSISAPSGNRTLC